MQAKTEVESTNFVDNLTFENVCRYAAKGSASLAVMFYTLAGYYGVEYTKKQFCPNDNQDLQGMCTNAVNGTSLLALGGIFSIGARLAAKGAKKPVSENNDELQTKKVLLN